MLGSSNALAKAQNTEIQIDGVLCSRCLFRYYRHDKGNFTTTIQSRTNEKKNNRTDLPFSRVGKSKSYVVSSANIKTQEQNQVWLFFCSMAFLNQWASFLQTPKHRLFNCLNSHIFKHYVILLDVSLIKICPLTCSCLSISINWHTNKQEQVLR